MTRYCITYTDPEAVYPAPKQTVTVEVAQADVWDHAAALGTVKKIYDLDRLQTVYSIHWNHNYLNLTQAQINANLEF